MNEVLLGKRGEEERWEVYQLLGDESGATLLVEVVGALPVCAQFKFGEYLAA
jgi:hypothetical protein